LNFPSESKPKAHKLGGKRKTDFVGVAWDVAAGKWNACITLVDDEASQKADGFDRLNSAQEGVVGVRKQLVLGLFDDQESAARKYDEVAAQIGRPLNFPPNGEAKATRTRTTAYVGVVWDGHGQWVAKAQVDGVPSVLRHFATDAEAAKAYDNFVRIAGRPLNFPVGPDERQAARTTGKSSQFVGVNWCARSGKWRVNLALSHETAEGILKNANKSLGYFEDEEAAAMRYDEGAACHGKPVNFPGPGQIQALKGRPPTTNDGAPRKRRKRNSERGIQEGSQQGSSGGGAGNADYGAGPVDAQGGGAGLAGGSRGSGTSSSAAATPESASMSWP
jgi:hypothetical protein